MAEVVAGAVIVEEAVSTTLQAGLATYAVAKPTAPLKAQFYQIATTTDDDTRLSLHRSHHSITVVGDKAYVFAGRTSPTSLAGNEVHAVSLLPQADAEKKAETQYSVIPAIAATEEGKVKDGGQNVPAPRAAHAAAALNVCVAVFGGLNDKGSIVDQDSTLWLFNTSNLEWESIKTSHPPPPRADATLCPYGNGLILYGGTSSSGESLNDVWHFAYPTRTWTALPDAPVAGAQAAACSDTLYLLNFPSDLSSDLHYLPLKPVLSDTKPSSNSWITETVPTNPLVGSPHQRQGTLVLPLDFGYGRIYLLYLLGNNHSDAWTLQLPAPGPVPTQLSRAGAAVKDSIRRAVGAETGSLKWAEVDISIPKEVDVAPNGSSGKLHPGPRAWAAGDVTAEGHNVVLWGGVCGAEGSESEERLEGDGWIIRLE